MTSGLFRRFPCNQDHVLVQSCLQDPLSNKFQSLDLNQSPYSVPELPWSSRVTSKGISLGFFFPAAPIFTFLPGSQAHTICAGIYKTVTDLALCASVSGVVIISVTFCQGGDGGRLRSSLLKALRSAGPSALPVPSAIANSPLPAELLRPSLQEPK